MNPLIYPRDTDEFELFLILLDNMYAPCETSEIFSEFLVEVMLIQSSFSSLEDGRKFASFFAEFTGHSNCELWKGWKRIRDLRGMAWKINILKIILF